jgi:hypothetical protein
MMPPDAAQDTWKEGRDPFPPMPNGAFPPLTLIFGIFGFGIVRCSPENRLLILLMTEEILSFADDIGEVILSLMLLKIPDTVPLMELSFPIAFLIPWTTLLTFDLAAMIGLWIAFLIAFQVLDALDLMLDQALDSADLIAPTTELSELLADLIGL